MADKKSWGLGSKLRGMFSRTFVLSDDTWDDLEATLLGADFGPDVTDELIEAVRASVAKIPPLDENDFVRLLREVLEERLSRFDTTLNLKDRPAVVLVVGVNGVGKTTTIGKLAKFITTAGRSVVLGAADTFRAAAVDQLGTWAERAGVQMVRPQQEGQDPSSVAYQTVEFAVANSVDVAIVDTAGRLQTKSGLMDELSKIRRVIEKQSPIAEVLLVLDATTGQNGLVQAEAFLEHAGVTGLVLTKLDGSAKGGFVLAVQERTGIPVKLVGSGEGIGDLSGFKLDFHFAPNPYFDDATLSKTFHIPDLVMKEEGDDDDDDDGNGMNVKKIDGCDIHWKAGKNVTVKVTKKKAKPGKGGEAWESADKLADCIKEVEGITPAR
jgi:fused signal recognition particle receptor